MGIPTLMTMAGFEFYLLCFVKGTRHENFIIQLSAMILFIISVFLVTIDLRVSDKIVAVFILATGNFVLCLCLVNIFS